MWKMISSKKVFDHPRITLLEDTVELPDGSQVPYLKYAHRNDSAMVICIRDGKVLLQREYSYPPNETLYQFPGGKVEADEAPEAAARRELVEEAGLQAEQLRLLGAYFPENRRSEAKMHVYLCNEPVDTEKAGGDLEEDISSQWVAIDQVDSMMSKGELVNGSLLAGWSLYKASQK